MNASNPTKPALSGSMTGYARKQVSDGSVVIEVDLRSVNHRHLEVSCRLPREFGSFEAAIRTMLTESLHRGKVDCSIVRKGTSVTSEEFPSVDRIAAYMRAYAQLAKDFGVHDDCRAELLKDLLLRRDPPGTTSELAVTDAEREALLAVVKGAIDDLIAMRTVEGGRLLIDIRNRLKELEGLRLKIQEHALTAPAVLKQRILDRIGRLAPEVSLDPSRLSAEVALIADRVDVSEEIVRLESHFLQIYGSLDEPPSGRKLDFLIQECVREFNTIGSKAQDACVQSLVVEGKVTLEKVREQVQNLE